MGIVKWREMHIRSICLLVNDLKINVKELNKCELVLTFLKHEILFLERKSKDSKILI